MEFNLTLGTVQQKCRICLQKGEVNIWDYKVPLNSGLEPNEISSCFIESIGKSFLQIMEIFSNSEQELLSLTDEFPLSCLKCLENLKFCYIFYEKIKLANMQLQNLYQESLNQYIEEEHLVDVMDEKEMSSINDIETQQLIENSSEEKEEITEYSGVNVETELEPLRRKSVGETSVPNRSKNVSLNKNDAFVVTQFIPTTLEAPANLLCQTKYDNNDECRPPQNLLTMNLKAVEIRDLKSLENLESCQTSVLKNFNAAVYICQYCPQAFAKSDYLKTHIQKSHVCKFCTQAFVVTEDLFRHLREAHKEHKCVICQKILSSHTNLRHHIRRVHQINLPAKVTLLDFIKSSNLERNAIQNEVTVLQEEIGVDSMKANIQYVWNNNNGVEMLHE